MRPARRTSRLKLLPSPHSAHVGFLLTGFFFEFGKHFAGSLLGGLSRCDANGAAGLQVHEGGGDFAPVPELERALAQATIGYQRDSIGDATIDFDVRDQAFALGNRIVDAELAQSQHRQANSKDLAGAEMTVGLGGQVQIFG